WRLLAFEQQVYSDGWAPGWSTYTYFGRRQHGTLLLTLSRQGFNGDVPAAHAKITVGTLKIVNGQAAIGRVLTVRRTIVKNGSYQVVRIPVARTPFRLVLNIKPTIPPSTDPRNLGAQVVFKFVPG